MIGPAGSGARALWLRPQLLKSMSSRISNPAVGEQLGRILDSKPFREAVSLKKFLRFIVEETLAGRGDQIKESVIALEVLGKRPDFDGRIDNSVRVKAHRLRERLDAYYREYGAGDEVLIEVPKGTYKPRFSVRRAAADANGTAPGAGGKAASGRQPRRARYWYSLAVLGAFLAGVAFAYFTPLRNAPAGAQGSTGLLQPFWGRLAHPRQPVLIAYMDLDFLLGPGLLISRLGPWATLPLRAQRSAAAEKNLAGFTTLNESSWPPPETMARREGLTFYGEVEAVHHLTRALGDLGTPVQVKRSRHLRAEDFARHDVVVLGAPVVHEALEPLLKRMNFFFENDRTIVNRDPRPGEPASFHRRFLTSGAPPIETTYGVVASLRSLGGNELVLLGGLGTHATLGAARYAADAEGVSELVRRLGTVPGGLLPPCFEAVLRHRIFKGQIASTEWAAGRAVPCEAVP